MNEDALPTRSDSIGMNERRRRMERREIRKEGYDCLSNVHIYYKRAEKTKRQYEAGR